PATPRCRPEERLIVDRSTYLTEKDIRSNIASKEAGLNKEAVLEGISFNIHLLKTNLSPHADVVTTANHVESVRDREHIGPALEGSKSSVAKRPVASHQGGSH